MSKTHPIQKASLMPKVNHVYCFLIQLTHNEVPFCVEHWTGML